MSDMKTSSKKISKHKKHTYCQNTNKNEKELKEKTQIRKKFTQSKISS